MKKTTKFLFGLASTILMATGCELAGTTPEKTAEEKVQEAHDLLVYSGLSSVVNNFDLIQTVAGLEDVKITYTVPETAAKYLEVVDTTMQVTLPTFTEGDQMLEPGFTATFTLDDVKKTKDFKVKVLAAPEENTDLTLVTNPVKDTNYKLGFVGQTETLFFSGSKAASYYGSTSNLPYKGVDVQLKETTGGYNLTFTDSKGVTQYIFVNVTTNNAGTHTNFDWSTTLPEDGCVWTIDSTNNTLTTTFGGERHWIGSSGTYGTFDAFNDTEKEEDNAYLAHLYTFTGEIPDAPTHPAYATTLSTEKEYNLGMVIADDSLVYFTGEMNGYYGATDTDVTKAVVAKVEETTGGYNLTFTKDSAKKYINVVESVSGEKTYYNFKIQDTASTVYTWNEDYDTLTTVVGETTYYMGTYDSNKTVGFSKFSYISTSFPLRFYEVTGTTTPTDPVDPEPETPTTPTEVTIAQALEVGATLDGDSKEISETVYQVSGTVSRGVGKYGKVYLTDGTNKIQVFKYNDPYTNLYDGYTATVKGNIQNYSGTIEVVNFEVVEFTAVKYSITIPTFENGAITATATSNIDWGTEVTFTVTPNTGYVVDKVSVNGTDVTVTNNTFKWTVDRNLTIAATFKVEVAGEKTLTLDFVAGVEGLGADYSDGSLTSNGVTYGFTQCKQNDGYMMLCKNKSAQFYNTTAIPGNIVKLEVTTTAICAAAATYKINLFTTVQSSFITEGTDLTGQSSTAVLTAEASEAKSYFNISLQNNGKNGQIAKIIITYMEA